MVITGIDGLVRWQVTPEIGDWTARVASNSHRLLTKWHKVESVINGEAVTRCGRVMGGENMIIGYGFQPEAQCHYCGPEF